MLSELANKTSKSKQYVREQISRKASRLGISSVAAQLAWAKEEGTAITRPLNKVRLFSNSWVTLRKGWGFGII